MKNPCRILLVLICLAAAAPARAAETAGEVVLANGAVTLERGGARQKLSLGQGVQAGDVFRTGADGYLYLKLRDGGFVALRPGSRAAIAEYTFRPGEPASIRVRLQLDEGVMRTVTGAGLRDARDRFRLNTPVAAIGVRGTDFTTYADSLSTRVSVVEGGVVMAPLGGACAAQGLGPCEGDHARELFAGRTDLMLVLGKGDVRPELVPAGDRSPDRVRPALPGESRAPSESRLPTGTARGAGIVTAPGDLTEAQILSRLDSLTPPAAEPVVTLPAAEPVVTLPAAEPVVAPPAGPPTLIHWGRWRDLAADRPAEFDLTSRLRAGEKYVASNYSHAMTRIPGEMVLPAGGTVSFSLQGGEAWYRDGSTVAAATIANPELTVDFTQRTFSTRLDVSALGNTWRVTAAGDVDGSGGLRSQFRGGTNATVNGSLGGTRGEEAAYLFVRPIDGSGRDLTGATYWTRP